MQIKVLTFNIHHGKGLDNRVDLSRISKIIQSTGADVIGLNEVDKHFSKRSEFLDQAEWLAKKLGMDFVFGPAITSRERGSHHVRQYGNAILSRFPIIRSNNHPFDFLPNIIEERALLEADISIKGTELSVFVAHLSFAPFLHGKQTNFILDQVQRKQNPIVVMGDWNMYPFTKSWKLATSVLKDPVEEQAALVTYPAKKPRVRLDYIFIRKDMNVIDTEVIMHEPIASDHLPLLATLQLI
ncbi:endonuclease/exonuclease/phosphatase family protein [Bacillus sp. T33-2]|uniref:endonuclease/exonuclease/phosphatase family protein n=1 Tax=Bacillus sp. T33-2 TaxID=2054168 RepID=UPI000C77E53E|nr:endonuclease/exonuclease/phosphatase family protein [Bacillus sp. T33-2]PLR98752.1 endonuclease [Bacillus sp. T33-2]